MPVILAWEVAQGGQDGVQFLPDTHPNLGDSHGAAFRLLWLVPHCMGANWACEQERWPSQTNTSADISQLQKGIFLTYHTALLQSLIYLLAFSCKALLPWLDR